MAIDQSFVRQSTKLAFIDVRCVELRRHRRRITPFYVEYVGAPAGNCPQICGQFLGVVARYLSRRD